MSLQEDFAYYTEVQLATLEGLEMRKATSKSELTRQRGIAEGMVKVCRREKLEPLTISGR